MIEPDLITRLRSHQRTSRILSSLLIGMMMISISVGVLQLGQRLAPGWNGGYLVIIAVFLSLEAIYTRGSIRDLEFNQVLIFRLSEWVAFAVLIKLLIYLFSGFENFFLDVRSWQANFTDFFTIEYLLALGVAALVWFSSRAYSSELDDLFDREQDAAWDDLGKLQNALNDIRKRMMGRVFFQGTLLTIFAIFTRINASELLRTFGVSTPGYRAPVLNLLVYFMLALVLLSQTQFALLRTRWTWLHLSITPKMSANWIKYSLLFFAVLCGVVFLLPTEYSLGLFDTLQVVATVLTQILSFLVFLITLPFTFCVSLFSASSGQPTASPLPPMGPMSPIQPSPSAPFAWLAFLRSLLFWVIFLAVIFFSLSYYLRQNTPLLNALRTFPLMHWLARGWQAFRRWFNGVNRQVSSLVQSAAQRMRIRRPALSMANLRDLFDTRQLSPRDKVIYFFVSLTQLGGERGLGRQPHQTPYQYENQLSQAVPEVEPDLHNLTEAFYEARYSEHPLEEPQAERAGSLWDHIKAVLRSWQNK